tara:strand:+ start:219 stop:758 length:540 start_codon:yes stop_codon:yes gene_type:complete
MNNKLFIFIYLFMISSCSNNKSQNLTQEKIDICRCLNEPGNTKWAISKKEECDKMISDKLDVKNWKNINFSKNKKLSIQWDRMVQDCINSQLNLEVDTKISFIEAKEFIQKRFLNIGQRYIDGKIIFHDRGGVKAYYFLSQNTQYTDYYCLTGVSSNNLEVLGDVNCGKDEIIIEFENK